MSEDFTQEIRQRAQAKLKVAHVVAQAEPVPALPVFAPWRPLPVPQLAEVPAYRPDMMPARLRPWLEDVAERGQFQFDFLAVAAMAALGSGVGRRCAVYLKQNDDWYEFPNLWAAIIGRPGAMKSPSLSAALSPLRALEAQWAAQHASELSQHEVEVLRATIAFKAALARAERAAQSGNDFDVPEKPSIEAPICRRLLTSDPTEAKLGELMSQNPYGIVFELDELAVLHAMFEREPSLREFCLKGWSGKESHTVDRMGRGTLRIEAVCLSIIGGIQPGRIAPLVQAAMQGKGADGLLQRFQLIAWPDGWSQPWRNVDRWPDSHARNEVRNLFERLAGMSREDFPCVGEFGPRGLRFTREAQDCFDDWHAGLHQTLRAGDVPEVLEAALAKGAKAVAGIALLCELADNPQAQAIGIDSLIRSLEWRRVSECHTRRLFSSASQAEADAASFIWKRIESGDLTNGFSAREIKQRHWNGLSESAVVDAGLSILVECGWLGAFKIESAGRPTHRYEINPAAPK